GGPEAGRAEVAEDGEVPEGGEELRVEGGAGLLEDRLRGAGERRVADPFGEDGVVARLAEEVVAELRLPPHHRELRGGRVHVFLRARPDVPEEEDEGALGEAAVHDAVEVRDSRRDLPEGEGVERLVQ